MHNTLKRSVVVIGSISARCHCAAGAGVQARHVALVEEYLQLIKQVLRCSDRRRSRRSRFKSDGFHRGL